MGFPDGASTFRLRDDHFRLLAECTVPDVWNGATTARAKPAWDAAHHCVWFCHDVLYRRSLHNGKPRVYRWDYQSGRTEAFSLEMAGAFQAGGTNFMLASAHGVTGQLFGG